MKNYKKNISKLKYIKLNPTKNEESQDEYELADQALPEEIVNNNDNQEINNPTTSYKKFDDEIEVLISKSKNSFALPKFLSKNKNDEKSSARNFTPMNPGSVQTPNALPYTKPDFKTNPNSFTSVFSKDNDQVVGVARVFRKSIMFLILQVLCYLALIIPLTVGIIGNFSSLTSTGISFVVLTLGIIFYTVITSIFYIIVADRSYIWINLFLQSLLLIVINSFIGQGFSIVTLITAFMIFVLSYFSYLEVEKVQVSSRFFSINYVTNEAIKILTTVAIIVISITFFNTILNIGSKNFVTQNLVQNDFVFRNIVVGKNANLSLNRWVLPKNYTIGENSKIQTPDASGASKSITFFDFLSVNYRKGEPVLNEKELENIKKTQCLNKEKECDTLIQREKISKIQKWLSEETNPYSSVNYTEKPTYLENPGAELDVNSFKEIMKVYYSEKITDFEADKSFTKVPFLDNVPKQFLNYGQYLIPAIFALILFIIFMILKFFLHLISGVAVWIVWKILLLFGFAQIEVELVESEIVSI
jgi:hypothetical protein